MWKTSNISNFIQVSCDGKVRRLFKNGVSIYNGNVNCDGYKRVKICINGIIINKFVHVLVAETFLPNPNNLPQVNHKDGNKLNNCVSNLEWCTASQNMQHAYDNKLKRTDKKHSRAKLDELDVLDIYSSNLTIKELCSRYNVSKSVICRIRSGKTWRWLTQNG